MQIEVLHYSNNDGNEFSQKSPGYRLRSLSFTLRFMCDDDDSNECARKEWRLRTKVCWERALGCRQAWRSAGSLCVSLMAWGKCVWTSLEQMSSSSSHVVLKTKGYWIFQVRSLLEIMGLWKGEKNLENICIVVSMFTQTYCMCTYSKQKRANMVKRILILIKQNLCMIICTDEDMVRAEASVWILS